MSSANRTWKRATETMTLRRGLVTSVVTLAGIAILALPAGASPPATGSVSSGGSLGRTVAEAPSGGSGNCSMQDSAAWSTPNEATGPLSWVLSGRTECQVPALISAKTGLLYQSVPATICPRGQNNMSVALSPAISKCNYVYPGPGAGTWTLTYLTYIVQPWIGRRTQLGKETWTFEAGTTGTVEVLGNNAVRITMATNVVVP